MIAARIVIPVVLLLLAAPATVAGETVQEPIHGFSVTVPDGWRQVPVDSLNEIFGGSRGVQFLVAMVGTRDGSIGHPFVAIQFIKVPIRNKTFEEVKWQFDQDALSGLREDQRDSLVAISHLARAAGKMKTCLDPYVCRLATYNERDFAGAGNCRGLAITYFVPNGLIQLNFWDKAADYSANLPRFGALVRSFRFDEGREWSQAAEYTAEQTAGSAGGGLPIGLIVGAGAGLIAGVVAMVLRSRRRPARPRGYGRGRPPPPERRTRGRRPPRRPPGRRGR